MANPYDQFVQPQRSAPSGVNPYDQFVSPSTTNASYQEQANIDEMPWYQRATVGVGHGMMDVAHGIGQVGLEAGNKLGVVNSSTLKNYNDDVDDQDRIFSTLSNQSNAAKIGNFGGNIAAALPLGFGAEGLAAKAGGAIGDMIPGSIGALGTAGKALNTASKALSPGAAIGGSQFTHDGDSRLGNAAEGAVLSGITAGGASAAGAGIKSLGANLPVTGSMQRILAGKRIAGVSDPASVIQSSPVSGLPLTLGQSTNDPGILALEKSMATKPGSVGGFVDQRTQANQAITGALHNMGADTPLDQSALAMRQNIEGAHSAARDTERSLWDAIDPDNTTSISTAPLKSKVQNYIETLPKADRKTIPGDAVSTIMDDFGDNEPLKEFSALHSSLQSDVRSAYGSSNFNQARMLGDIDRIVMGHLDDLPIANKSTLDAYNTARGYSKDINQIYRQTPIKNILGVDATGADRVPETATGAKIIKTGPGASESVDSYLKATNNDPGAIQDAQKYFMRNMLEKSQQATEDQQGSRFINSSSLRAFYDKNQPVINKLFTPEQQEQIGNIVKGSQMTARTMQAGLPGGSDTALKLAGQDRLNTLVGSIFDNTPIVGKVTSALNSKVNNYVQRGLLDPAYGDMLMKRSVAKPSGLIPQLVNNIPAAVAPYGLLNSR